jgi:hypothetical protein
MLGVATAQDDMGKRGRDMPDCKQVSIIVAFRVNPVALHNEVRI